MYFLCAHRACAPIHQRHPLARVSHPTTDDAHAAPARPSPAAAPIQPARWVDRGAARAPFHLPPHFLVRQMKEVEGGAPFVQCSLRGLASILQVQPCVGAGRTMGWHTDAETFLLMHSHAPDSWLTHTHTSPCDVFSGLCQPRPWPGRNPSRWPPWRSSGRPPSSSSSSQRGRRRPRPP